MKNISNEVSDSDDSELIDDPSPVPSTKSTRLDKSATEKNFNKSVKESNHKGNEADLSDSSNDDSSNNSTDKLVKKTNKSSTEVYAATKNKSLGNDTADIQATFSVEDLSSDDEVYLFHCPENFKKHDLLNQIIDVSKSKQHINSKDGENYQLKILNSENKLVTLAVPQKSSGGRLFNLPSKGHMLIQKIFQMENHSISDLVEMEETVAFPDDIKIRHPFLGVNWKSYIDSAREAIEKNQFSKKMKKKIKKEKTEEIVDVENKKLKKRKSSCVQEIALPKKHKKKI